MEIREGTSHAHQRQALVWRRATRPPRRRADRPDRGAGRLLGLGAGRLGGGDRPGLPLLAGERARQRGRPEGDRGRVREPARERDGEPVLRQQRRLPEHHRDPARQRQPARRHRLGNHFYAFAATGQLESLTSRLEESGLMETWQESYLEGAKYDGEYLSLPLHGHSRMLYYNTEYFAQAGIEEPPTTPDELKADIDAIAALGLEGVSPWGATTTSHTNLFGESNAFVLGMGGSWIKDGEWTVTSPETVAALELYRELTKMAPPGLDGGKYRQLFADGRIAAIHDGNWVQAFLDEVAPADVLDQLVPAPSPFPRAVATLGTGLSIPSGISEERKDLVWELIQIAAEPKFQ